MKVDTIVFYDWVCTHVFVEARCELGFLIFTNVLFFYEYLAVTCYLEIDDLGSQVCVERSVLLHDIQVCNCVTNPTGCWIAPLFMYLCRWLDYTGMRLVLFGPDCLIPFSL